MKASFLLLVALFPQDVFYSISPDSFAAGLGGIAFSSATAFFVRKRTGNVHAVVAGILLAALAMWNLASAALAGGILVFMIPELRDADRRHRNNLFLLAGTAVVILGVWMASNLSKGYDPLAAGEIIKARSWKLTPLAGIPDHPIFGATAFAKYLFLLISLFWRGEFYWHGAPLSYSISDSFYVFSSLAFVACALVLKGGKANQTETEKRLIRSGLAMFSAGVCFLAAASVAIDFRNSYAPSRSFAFFANGRYISGAILPFTYAYVAGMSKASAAVSQKHRSTLLVICMVVVAAFITFPEAIFAAKALASEYNWFHLP